MTTTVVLASQGQLGSLILRSLRAQGIDAVGVDMDICNLEDPGSIQDLFVRFPKMERLYNGAAFTAVDAAEVQSRRAFRINALGPGFLAARCAERDVELIHFSTDYVFGEGHSRPISEEVGPNPISTYGRSKVLGEELVLGYHPGAKVLRSCGLYSSHRPNFVRTMIELGLRGGSVEVVCDQIMGPTGAARLAEAAILVADQGRPGLYHATAQGSCSWFEFAQAIFEELAIDVEVIPVESAQWAAPAARPPYSVLENGLLRDQGLDIFDDWRQELSEFLQVQGARLLDQAAKELEIGRRRAS